jgi:hypothetical protein
MICVKIIDEEGIYFVTSKEVLELKNVIITDNTGYSLLWTSKELVVLEKEDYPELYL